MNEIEKILMERDGMSQDEAHELFVEAKDQFDNYLQEGDEESAYNICEEYFGLEPDYIFDLM